MFIILYKRTNTSMFSLANMHMRKNRTSSEETYSGSTSITDSLVDETCAQHGMKARRAIA